MNNLHKELAPVSDEAWSQIEEEARRTFVRYVANRRVVDVVGPRGPELSAVGTGHVTDLATDNPRVRLRQREVAPLVEIRVPFTVARAAVDDVLRGAQDSDWQPVKDAAREIAFAEDHAALLRLAPISGIIPNSSNAPIAVPSDPAQVPTAVAQAVDVLRQAGVNGPYSLLLSAEIYTIVGETTDHGYPILEHIARILRDGEIVWAPAISGGLLLSTRGGDYELHLGQDLSIGYLSHDAENVELYLEETLTFRALTAEASVPLQA